MGAYRDQKTHAIFQEKFSITVETKTLCELVRKV